jgi:hypothetical protein
MEHQQQQKHTSEQASEQAFEMKTIVYSQEQLVNLYIQQFNSVQKKAYEISQSHLKSSFNILRSNGYIEWKKKFEKE